MSVLLLLIPVSLVLSGVFVAICIASIRSGQFDDLESPPWRVLMEGPADMGSAGGKANLGKPNEEIG